MSDPDLLEGDLWSICGDEVIAAININGEWKINIPNGRACSDRLTTDMDLYIHKE